MKKGMTVLPTEQQQRKGKREKKKREQRKDKPGYSKRNKDTWPREKR
jgi:hypothetical protein